MAKEFWRMSRLEYDRCGGEEVSREELDRAYELRKEEIRLERLLIETAGIGTYEDRALDRALKSRKPGVRDAKEAYLKIHETLRKISREIDARYSHKGVVKRALEAEMPVPPDVRAEYPDLI